MSSRDRLNISDLLVLLVEPSSTQRNIVIRQLSEIGVANTILVDKGAEALEQMHMRKPDLVIGAFTFDTVRGKVG